LGLATIYGIVKQNSGSIQVYSEQGLGTAFKIYWPRVVAETTPRVEQLQVDEPPSGTETILLTEDETTVREMTASILKEQGYTVLEAANGQEALRLAQEHRGQIQLLLTDVVMPQMSGKELAEQLQAGCPAIKVLYASGYMDDAIAHHGVLEPGIAFIQKPFSPADVARKVREVLDA
jgi:CheY-like chemotaxis protein